MFTLEMDQAACLPLFANILVRLELRFCHDGDAIYATLSLPLASLNGAESADLLSGGATALRDIRASINGMAAPTVRWWRIGH